ncbi:MAG: hypothetical protein L3J26_08740 [Candidatus Polarisedimenticolaceae bacterium]|nr:hypothetical protein [Candidatus Polarisedimenticolaceae bacterium]
MNYFMRKDFAVCFGVLLAMAMAAPVAAIGEVQSIEQIAVDEVEVTRGADELQAVLRPHPDLDVVNTVLVFNNVLSATVVVRCVAYGVNGRPLGKINKVKIPGNGLRFILASDLANGRDFVGSTLCHSEGKIVPAAFIAGRILTDTPAKTTHGWPGTKIRFPTVVTY